MSRPTARCDSGDAPKRGRQAQGWTRACWDAGRLPADPGCATSGRRSGPPGFTLVELLLAVALLLLLVSAVAFNFASLRRGAAIEEATSQVESLSRYARAYAATTGQAVELRFDGGLTNASAQPERRMRLVRESEPGVEVDVAEAGPFLERLSDLVIIESVRLTEMTHPDASAMDADPAFPGAGAEDPGRTDWATVHFFPDGSGESFEITLTARDPDDGRRWLLRHDGLTGSVRRLWLAEENLPVDDTEDAESAPGPAATEDPRPAMTERVP